MTILLQIALLLFCLASVAFFAGIETGIVSVNRLRLLHKSRNGSKEAAIIEGLLHNPDRLLGTTLVGSNLASVIVATLMASLGAHYAGYSGQAAAGVVTALVILIFGEYLPKIWFTSRPLSRTLHFARLLALLEKLLYPLASFSLILTRWVLKGKKDHKRFHFVTREHLHLLTRDSEAGGQISTFERLMISRVLDLQIKTSADIMTPLRHTIFALEGETIADVVKKITYRGHMKIPLLSKDGQRCLGIINMQEILGKMPAIATYPVAPYAKPPFFIASTVRADDVLPLLRHNRQRIAIINDSSHHILGIVTIENVLKILMGNLPLTATGDRRSEPAPLILHPTMPTTPEHGK